jgi:hypothetical protein
MFQTHFYHRTIRKCIVAFGTLFNNIYVYRYTKDGSLTKERFKVPLNYGPKEKYIQRITQDPTLTKSVAITVPRMSFEMTNLTYDSTRKQQSTLMNFAGSSGTNTVKSQYIPVPYNIEFSLSLYVRNHEDGTQIIEQILPYFTPDYTMTVNINPEMGKSYDFPVILDTVNQDIQYEGDFLTTRLITWTLTFTAKTFMFGPVSNSAIIMGVSDGHGGYTGGSTVNIRNDTNNSAIQKIYMANNASNVANVDYAQSEVVRSKANNIFGLVADWNANSKILYITQANGLFQNGMMIVGDYSNATYNVASMAVANTLMVSVTSVQDPITAKATDAYGFSDTIIEYEL